MTANQKVETWGQIQELTDEIWSDTVAVESLRRTSEVVALERIAAQGFRAVGEPKSEVVPVMVPYIEPSTGATIVGAIHTKVRCVRV